MSPKSYFLVSGTVFLIVAIVHFLRVINGWELNIHSFDAPMLVSWVGLLLGGYLAYQGLRKR